MTLTKHQSKSDPNLFFWAEPNTLNANTHHFFIVVAQSAGFPASEAHYDWLANREDTDRIARQMAEGTFEP